PPARAGAGPPPEPAATALPPGDRLPAIHGPRPGTLTAFRGPDRTESGRWCGQRGKLARTAVASRVGPAALPLVAQFRVVAGRRLTGPRHPPAGRRHPQTVLPRRGGLRRLLRPAALARPALGVAVTVCICSRAQAW